MSDESINEQISQEIVKLRKEAGFTSYEKFAIEHDFARKHYWMVEKGKIRITVEYLQRLLICHNLTLRAFFERINR